MNPLYAAALVNGQPATAIALADRGLQYGDGLFETVRVSGGRCRHWALHLERLRRGCEALGIRMPDPELLKTEARRLLASGDFQEVILKLIITRGRGGRGYAPRNLLPPSRILSVHPLPRYPAQWYRDGVAARFCDTRLSSQPRLAGIKHLNRLEQVLARQEWESDFAEGLMLDDEGHVVEGVMSNLFVLIGDRLVTPPVDRCGVDGVIRQWFLRHGDDIGHETLVQTLKPEQLLTADGVFLTNSVIGVWQVTRLQRQRWRPHPLTETLRALAARDDA